VAEESGKKESRRRRTYLVACLGINRLVAGETVVLIKVSLHYDKEVALNKDN
jgi:hypothetical protein